MHNDFNRTHDLIWYFIIECTKLMFKVSGLDIEISHCKLDFFVFYRNIGKCYSLRYLKVNGFILCARLRVGCLYEEAISLMWKTVTDGFRAFSEILYTVLNKLMHPLEINFLWWF